MACFAVSKCPVHSFNTFSYCFVLPTETEEYNPEERFVENRLTSARLCIDPIHPLGGTFLLYLEE